MTQDVSGFFDEGALVSVLTTEPLGRALDYRAPEGGCFTGAFVEVPLGPRRVLGVVWGAGEGGYDLSKVRPVTRVLDAAPMGDAMRAFLIRAADYTLTPMPAMLRLASRAPGLADPPGPRKVYRKGRAEPDRMTEARARVISVLDEYGGAAFTLSELAALAGITTSVIKGMVKIGAVAEEEAPRDLPYPALDPDLSGKPLAPDQAKAAAQLRTAVAGGRYGTTLLKGVTGSGKTEVYLEAVAECLAKGRQALVLLPEIALTSEFLARVEERFGARPGEWHSGVTQTERRRLWRMAGEGRVGLVVGARSALFLPFRDLGLIVAKGHNFPLLTLVGVIDADLGLQGSDLRAAERTFQLVRQVSGRAGRSDKPGVALIQSYQPEHPVIRAILSGEEEAFWRAEAAERQAAGMPPFGRLAGIILSSPDVQTVFDFGTDLARRDAPLRRIGAQVFGPAPAPVARVRGRHRVRLLVKAEKAAPLQAALTEWVAQMKVPANLRVAIDIDPQSFY